MYIAGEGPEKDNIEKFIKENNLEQRVELLGFLSKEEVIDWTRKCRFTVVPSIWYENPSLLPLWAYPASDNRKKEAARQSAPATANGSASRLVPQR